MKCIRSLNISWCLDWREICDGIVDCWPDAIDEQYCDALKINECDINEYRCQNAQCIPKDFLLDNHITMDCLDGTDESYELMTEAKYLYKLDNTHFIHEDKSFRQLKTIKMSFDCSYSDSCRQEQHNRFIRAILFRTANLHISESCWLTMICKLQLSHIISLVSF